MKEGPQSKEGRRKEEPLLLCFSEKRDKIRPLFPELACHQDCVFLS